MDEILTSVNAEQGSAEGSQQDTNAPVGNTSEQAEVAAPQPEKKVQTPQQNSEYAKARREAETQSKALQAQIKEVLEYTGYDSYAELQQAIAEQKANDFKEQAGFDPETLTPYIERTIAQRLETDPVYSQIRAQNEQLETKQIIDEGLKEIQAVDPSINSVDALLEFYQRPEIQPLMDAGISPAVAYKAAYADKIATQAAEKARTEALKSVQRNGSVSPGSVGGGTDTSLTFTADQLQNLDKARLVSDDAYYRAAMDSYKRLRR